MDDHPNDEAEHEGPGPRLGDLVVEALGLRKAYGDTLLFDDLSFTLPRGGIVGVIGPNGAGKTTLCRMILGQEKPDAGELRVGDTVVLSYVDQSREALKGEASVWEEISDGGKDLVMVGKKEVNSRAYSACFGGGPITAGSTWNFQGYYRDPFGPCGHHFNLSNGLSLAFSQ